MRADVDINKLRAEAEKTVRQTSRVLVLFNSLVEKEVFSRLMNCVFVLQHREIVLDVITLTAQDLDTLTQATHKTKGTLFPMQEPNRGLLQYVLHVLINSSGQRDLFKMPYLTKTNFSGSCTCHNNRLDLAWVCSACLGVYCVPEKNLVKGLCKFCGVRYDLIDFNVVPTQSI